MLRTARGQTAKTGWTPYKQLCLRLLRRCYLQDRTPKTAKGKVASIFYMPQCMGLEAFADPRFLPSEPQRTLKAYVHYERPFRMTNGKPSWPMIHALQPEAQFFCTPRQNWSNASSICAYTHSTGHIYRGTCTIERSLSFETLPKPQARDAGRRSHPWSNITFSDVQTQSPANNLQVYDDAQGSPSACMSPTPSLHRLACPKCLCPSLVTFGKRRRADGATGSGCLGKLRCWTWPQIYTLSELSNATKYAHRVFLVELLGLLCCQEMRTYGRQPVACQPRANATMQLATALQDGPWPVCQMWATEANLGFHFARSGFPTRGFIDRCFKFIIQRARP